MHAARSRDEGTAAIATDGDAAESSASSRRRIPAAAIRRKGIVSRPDESLQARYSVRVLERRAGGKRGVGNARAQDRLVEIWLQLGELAKWNRRRVSEYGRVVLTTRTSCTARISEARLGDRVDACDLAGEDVSSISETTSRSSTASYADEESARGATELPGSASAARMNATAAGARRDARAVRVRLTVKKDTCLTIRVTVHETKETHAGRRPATTHGSTDGVRSRSSAWHERARVLSRRPARCCSSSSSQDGRTSRCLRGTSTARSRSCSRTWTRPTGKRASNSLPVGGQVAR